MRLIASCAILFLAACYGNAEDVCYYKVSINADYYRSNGLGIGPYGELTDDLWERFVSGELTIPLQSLDGETLFGESCESEEVAKYVQKFFADSQFRYSYLVSSEEEYLELHQRFLPKE